MVQDDYRKLYGKMNKGWQDSVSIYKAIVKSGITKDTVILEAGCGFSNMFKDEYKIARHVIGVDIDPKYLEMNDIVKEKIVSDLSDMPQVKTASVDLIISSWVLEHLKEPQKVFNEFSRVLKPGGKVVFITPNGFNYILLLNRIIPKWLRNKIARMLTKDLTVDPMPAFYKANSVGKIGKLCKNSRLKLNTIILNGDPTYVAINMLFFYIGIAIELVYSLPFLRRFKVHIIGVLER